jgi:hypothetical protein
MFLFPNIEEPSPGGPVRACPCRPLSFTFSIVCHQPSLSLRASIKSTPSPTPPTPFLNLILGETPLTIALKLPPRSCITKCGYRLTRILAVPRDGAAAHFDFSRSIHSVYQLKPKHDSDHRNIWPWTMLPTSCLPPKPTVTSCRSSTLHTNSSLTTRTSLPSIMVSLTRTVKRRHWKKSDMGDRHLSRGATGSPSTTSL